MSNGNPFDQDCGVPDADMVAVWRRMLANSHAESQSPLHANRNSWGRILQLDAIGATSTANTVDGVLLDTGVMHAQAIDADASPTCFLTIDQQRSMVPYTTRIFVPPWGVAYELPAGYTRCSIRPSAFKINVPTKWSVGITYGAAHRRWLQDPASPITVLAGNNLVLLPLPYSTRVMVSVLDGTLLAPSGANWLLTGQSATLAAATLKLQAPALTSVQVSVAWEVVS